MRHVIEPLERRRLLATHVINGTAGDNHWFIDCGPGVVRANGVQTNNPAITDVQINGFDGQDSVVIQSAGIPVVFNAGNGNDWISLTSGNLTPITSTLTFNGAGGVDYVEVRDTLYSPNTTYNVGGGNVFERATGHGRTVMDAGTESIRIEGGSGASNAYYINGLTINLGVLVTGGAGGDVMHVELNTTNGVNFDGAGGTDVLSVSDFNRAGGGTYDIGTQFVNSGADSIGYTNVESLSVQGSGQGPCTFNVQRVTLGVPTELYGWSFNDTFNVTAAWSGGFLLGPSLKLTGFGGNDAVTYNAQSLAAATIFNLAPGRIAANAPQSLLEFQQFETVTLLGPNNNSEYFAVGTSPEVTGQTTIYAGGGNNSVWVYPRNEAGELTLGSHLGVFGQGGTDSVLIWDLNSTLPINYAFSNPFGPGTADIAGLGAGLLGAFADVENIEVFAGDGDDTFAIDTFQNGSALRVRGGAGDDALRWTPTGKNLSAAVTSMSFFNFDGQAGLDTMSVSNDNGSAAFTYTHAVAVLRAQQTAGAYLLVMNHANTEFLDLTAGTGADEIRVLGVRPGTRSTFDGGGASNDVYRIGNGARTQDIRGVVRVMGGGGGIDTLVADDGADTVGRTFHIDGNTVGAAPGDDLFGPGGYLQFEDLAGPLGVLCGSGNDTAYVTPHPVTPITVDLGAQPGIVEGGGGDFAGFAFAAAANPVFTPGEPGAGTYTFDDHAPVSYTGAEDTLVDDVAPAVSASSFDVDLPAQAVVMTFSEDVSQSLLSSSFALTNTTTNQTISPSDIALAYDPSTNTATFTFPNFEHGVLADGDYVLTLPAGAVTDPFGNALAAEHTLNFFFMQADANRDRRVNLSDFNVLAANFGGTSRTFSQGDFNYDGTVNLADFNLLASRFGQAMAPDGTVTVTAKADRRRLSDMLDDVLA